MHAYSTDSRERQIIPLFIAAAAIVAGYFTPRVLAYFGWNPPWWFISIDTMGYYGAFYWLFNKWVWRTAPMRFFRITRIPELSGKWVGHIVSSYDEESGSRNPVDIELTIEQTWREMMVLGDTATSSSHNVSGSILVNQTCSLSYEYINEPKALAPATMHAHRGTARLTIAQEGNRLEGEYYSGRDRKNIGTISLRKIS